MLSYLLMEIVAGGAGRRGFTATKTAMKETDSTPRNVNRVRWLIAGRLLIPLYNTRSPGKSSCLTLFTRIVISRWTRQASNSSWDMAGESFGHRRLLGGSGLRGRHYTRLRALRPPASISGRWALCGIGAVRACSRRGSACATAASLIMITRLARDWPIYIRIGLPAYGGRRRG